MVIVVNQKEIDDQNKNKRMERWSGLANLITYKFCSDDDPRLHDVEMDKSLGLAEFKINELQGFMKIYDSCRISYSEDEIIVYDEANTPAKLILKIDSPEIQVYDRNYHDKSFELARECEKLDGKVYTLKTYY